jgi:ATP-binding cassette, subfamily C, bacterial exporter for protease/lipase
MSSNNSQNELREALLMHTTPLKQAMWFSWLTSLLVLAPVAFMFQVYGRVVDSQSLSTLSWLLALVTLAYVVMEVLDWARHEAMREASSAFNQSLAPRVFDVSRYSAQAATDAKTLREFFFSPALLAILEAPIALVFVVIMFALHPLLGFVSLVSALIQVFIAASQHQRSNADLKSLSKTQISSQKLAQSSLRNAHVVQGMGMYEAIHSQWRLTHEKFLSHQRAAMEHGGFFQATNKTFQLVLSSGLLGLGAWILMDGTLLGGPGMLIVASTIGARAIAPLGTVVMQWRSLIATKEAYQRLDHLLTLHPLKTKAMALPAPEGHLSVESVVASAPKSNAPILRGIQFNVKPGQMLAVIGPSGSGKSTLAKLLIGVWPALSGKVRLDGADVFSWDKNELGPSIGYVAQTVELFEGSIGQNISRFEAADDNAPSRKDLTTRIHSAAQAIGLHDLIETLPQGYDTQLGADGHNLSGGQMQRVAIARAIYGWPQLLVLDEANSHLDPQGETDLSQLLASLKQQGKTVVVMTHRKALLALADQVLVLRDGQQQLYGSKEDVLAKLGLRL